MCPNVAPVEASIMVRACLFVTQTKSYSLYLSALEAGLHKTQPYFAVNMIRLHTALVIERNEKRVLRSALYETTSVYSFFLCTLTGSSCPILGMSLSPRLALFFSVFSSHSAIMVWAQS